MTIVRLVDVDSTQIHSIGYDPARIELRDLGVAIVKEDGRGQ